MDVNLTSEGKVKLEPDMELPFTYQVCRDLEKPFIYQVCGYIPGFISESLTGGGGGGGGGKLHIYVREILGGNMKTHVAVYEEGLFDLRGGKTFLRGDKCPLSPPPPPPLKETLYTMYRVCVWGLLALLYV